MHHYQVIIHDCVNDALYYELINHGCDITLDIKMHHHYEIIIYNHDITMDFMIHTTEVLILGCYVTFSIIMSTTVRS